jgi:hypothetical protein
MDTQIWYKIRRTSDHKWARNCSDWYGSISWGTGQVYTSEQAVLKAYARMCGYLRSSIDNPKNQPWKQKCNNWKGLELVKFTVTGATIEELIIASFTLQDINKN